MFITPWGDITTVDNKIYDNVSNVRRADKIDKAANNVVTLLKYDGSKEKFDYIAAPSSKITTGSNRFPHDDKVYTQYGVHVIDNLPCKMSVIIQVGDEFIVNGVRVSDPNIADINYSLDCHYHVEVTMKDGTTTFKDTFESISAAPFATMDIKPDVTQLERICEDAWDMAVFAINRGNLIPAKGLTVYYGDGKYYDGNLNIVKHRKIDFPVDNYYIDEISHITVSEGNFCLGGCGRFCPN